VEKFAATFGGVLVLALLAGGLTEATLALGPRGDLANDNLLRGLRNTPAPVAATVTPSATPTPTPVATATPTPTPAATPAGPTVTTVSFVRMRAGKSTSTSVLAELNGGTVLQELPDSDAQWQQVKYGTLTGYVFKAYLSYQ
jgi:hypothetical protein